MHRLRWQSCNRRIQMAVNSCWSASITLTVCIGDALGTHGIALRGTCFRDNARTATATSLYRAMYGHMLLRRSTRTLAHATELGSANRAAEANYNYKEGRGLQQIRHIVNAHSELWPHVRFGSRAGCVLTHILAGSVRVERHGCGPWQATNTLNLPQQ